MKSVTHWYQFFTRCEELVPILHGVKFTKCEIYGLTQLPSIVYNLLCAGCLSSDWRLTQSLSGIQSSFLAETDMIVAFSFAVLH